MFVDSKSEAHNLTHRHAIARRQLHASIGAVVVIALVAMAAVASMNSVRAPDSQMALRPPTVRPVVKTVVRETPSQRLQATDQARKGSGG